MKYAIEHPRTRESLPQPKMGHWEIIGFFFNFRAGKGLANNFEGFLCSLLLQVVRKIPALAAFIRSYGCDELDPELPYI
jgi:hypothetical protein